MTPRPRVLIVAYNFPPHAAIGTMRTLRVVQQLHAAGWEITVLTGSPRTYLPGTAVDDDLLRKVPQGVHVLQVSAFRPWERSQRWLFDRLRGKARNEPSRTAAPSSGSAPEGKTASGRAVSPLRRLHDVVDAAGSIPDRENGWIVPAVTAGVLRQLRQPPDVIYVTSPPWTAMLIGLSLKSVLRRPLVADFRDPWSRAPWRGDRYNFALRAAARLERRTIRAADRVIFVARGNRDDFASFYGPEVARKFEVVSNGCDTAEFDALERPAVEPAVHVMLHAGSLYAGRTPEPLFRALSAAIARGVVDPTRFKLRFLGVNGIQSTDLPGICARLGLDRVVEFLPRVPRAEGIRAMVSSSSLLLLQPGHTVSVPGKVYEYLAAGRPILSVAEEAGETAQVVRESGVGVSVTPDDEEAMIEAIGAVVRMADAPMPRAPRILYDGNVGAARIETILRDATNTVGYRAFTSVEH